MTRSESSRINGAKSKGPTTESGRARSAQNNYRHGLYAKTVGLLSSEESETYHDAIREYARSFKPRSIAEAEWIVTMVNATWRLRRAEADLMNLTDIETVNKKNNWEAVFTPCVPDHLRPSLAFDANCKRRLETIDMIERTIAACTRIIARATTQLDRVRKNSDPEAALSLDEILAAFNILREPAPVPDSPPAGQPSPPTDPQNSRFEPESQAPQPAPAPLRPAANAKFDFRRVSIAWAETSRSLRKRHSHQK